jgi:hypothetical protein
MFPEPLNLNTETRYKKAVTRAWSITEITTLKDRVIDLFRAEGRIGWYLSYVTPMGEIPHLIANDTRYGGYAIGAIVYGLSDGSIVCRLESPGGHGMTTWQIPFKGTVTPEKITEAISACIEVFENEEIPVPDAEEEKETQITKRAPVMIQKSIQNIKTGEIAMLSNTTPAYWCGEKRDYALSEIENNPEWIAINNEPEKETGGRS